MVLPRRIHPDTKRANVEPFDVVIIAYNNPDITLRAVVSVLYGEPSARIILIDNGSREDLSPIGDMLCSRGHVFERLEANRGPYGAANAGIAHVRTEKFCFMCNDCAVFPGALRRLIVGLNEQYPYVCASEVQDKEFDPALFALLPEAVPPAMKVRKLNVEPGVFFTCFAAYKTFVEEIGPFDEDYQLTYGDTDWEQRANDFLKDTGRQLVQARDVVVFHGASVTRKRMGIEHDLAVDRRDYDTFARKWADRLDVMIRHPDEDVAVRQHTERGWTHGEK